MTITSSVSDDQRAEPSLSSPRSRGAPVDARELFEMALLVVALLADDLLLPRMMFGDGLDRFLELDTLLRAGALTVSRYSLIGPIFAAPLWWLGNLNGGVGGAMTEAQRYNPLLFGLGVVALYLILRRRIEGRLLRAFCCCWLSLRCSLTTSPSSMAKSSPLCWWRSG